MYFCEGARCRCGKQENQSLKSLIVEKGMISGINRNVLSGGCWRLSEPKAEPLAADETTVDREKHTDKMIGGILFNLA